MERQGKAGHVVFNVVLIAALAAAGTAGCMASGMAAVISSPPAIGKAHHRAARAAVAKLYDPALLIPLKLTDQAPAAFDAKFITTKGDFVIHVTRAWAPLGADRFYNLMKHHFYNRAGIFRVMPKFVVQFGISAYPDVSKAWHSADIKDDPVTQSNMRWTVSFATDGPNTRTTQIFINVADNKRLDTRGFAPFGNVTEGTKTIRKFYSGYGEETSKRQDEIEAQGKKFLDLDYPRLDSIKSAAIIPGSIVGAVSNGRAAGKSAAVAPAAMTPAVVAPLARSRPGALPSSPAVGSGDTSSTALADGAPTYEQTRLWIISKMNDAAGHREDNGDTVSYQNISLDGCVLKYREVWRSGYSDAHDLYDVSIPLLKLADATPREGIVKLNTTTTAVHIARQEKVRGQPDLTSSETNVSTTDGTFEAGVYGYVVNLDFRRQGIDAVDISSRMAAALRHASGICKEKAPKALEPF